MAGITLTVNGSSREVQAPPDTPLLYVLRNELELTGPQFGCGQSQCGACSVLVDGKEVRACVLPVRSVAGKEVTTLEGLPARWASRHGAAGGDPGAAPGAAGVDRRTGTAVRLLPERHDDQGGGAARADARPHGVPDQGGVHGRPLAAPLSLRQLRGDPRRREARRDAGEKGIAPWPPHLAPSTCTAPCSAAASSSRPAAPSSSASAWSAARCSTRSPRPPWRATRSTRRARPRGSRSTPTARS